MDRAAYLYPPPGEWQVFERLARDLFAYRWGDRNAQLNGRNGQPQAGVDVFGRNEGSGPYFGVQCKGRDGRFGQQVTEAELREEAIKARGFEPKLAAFTLITTAPTDVHLQKLARTITAENEAEGWFQVHCVGWDLLQQWMSPFDDLWTTYYPDYAPPRQLAPENFAHLEGSGPATRLVQAQHTEMLQQLVATLCPDGSAAEATTDTTDRDPLDDRIDDLRDLIESEPKVALKALQRLIANQPDASLAARFRIVTNIGSAKALLNRFKEASEDFLAAFELSPMNSKALTNRAFAYLLRNDYQRASSAARLAIASYPDNPRAYSLLINAVSACTPDVKPETLVPPAFLAQIDVVYAIAHAYGSRGDNDAALPWIVRANILVPERYEVRVGLGEALLSNIIDSDEAAQFGVLRNADDRPALVHCCRLLNQVWREVSRTGAAATFVRVALNLTLALRLLDQLDEAEAVIHAASQAAPGDPQVVDFALMIAVKRMDMSKALELLKQHKSQFQRDRPVLAAQILAANGELDEALALIGRVALTESEAAAHPLAVALESRWTLERDGPVPARESIRYRLLGHPAEVAAWVSAADVALSSGDRDEARTFVQRADKCLKADASFALVVAVADFAYAVSLPEIAFRRYREVAPAGRHSRELLRAFECAERTDLRRAALNIWRTLPSTLQDHPEYLWIAASLYLRVGDQSKAKRLLEAYRRCRPEDIVGFTNWAIVTRNLGLDEEVATALRTPMEHLSGSPEARTMMARLLTDYGHTDRGLDEIYRAYREGRRDPAVLPRVIGFVITCGVDLNQDKVGESSAVSLRFSDPVEDRTVVIEISPDAEPGLSEYSPTHVLARALLGQRRGAVVSVGPSTRKAEIVGIRHKAAFAAATISNSFDTQFPEERGFQRVHLQYRSDGTPDLKAVHTIAAEEEFTQERIFEVYRHSPLPIAFLAHNIGLHPVNALHWMSSRSDIAIHMCDGTEQERQAALAIIDSSKGFVLDLLAIATIVIFDLEKTVAEVLPRICVSQSTIESFANLVQERRQPSVGRLVKVNDDLRLHKISDAQRQHETALAERMHRFAIERCERVLAVPASDAPAVLRDILGNMDNAVGDTIYAASGENLPILSDDLALRVLAKERLGVDGVWLQPILMCACDRGCLTLERYAEIMVMYIEAGFNFVSVDTKLLWLLADASDPPNLRSFDLAVSSIQNRAVSPESALGVLWKFLRLVWSSDFSQRKREWVTNRVLRALLWERSSIAAYVLEQLPNIVPLDRRGELRIVVESWKRGYFL